MADKINNVRACVFDAYGTLFDVHSAVARGGEPLGEKAQSVSDLWRQKQLEYTWLRSLMPAHVDFWQVTQDGLDYAMAAHGIEDDELRDRLMQLYMRLDAYPEVPQVLRTLKEKGFKTAILSNGSPRMLSAAVESAGIANFLDDVLSVEDIGIYKPDPRIYGLAVDRLAVSPEQVCFMSSNAWDAAAAAHFGFQVAWVNRFNKPFERLPGEPKAIIDDLTKLPPLLGF
ncbi:MAG: haloacid dehalogenase type II [Kiloniellales bacterium]|nr:haloacid dehalogenase type II [Kiloniellales bacterium]